MGPEPGHSPHFTDTVRLLQKSSAVPQKDKQNYHMILLLSMYPREMKIYVYTETCIGMFIVEFITGKRWEQPNCCISGLIDR